MKLTRLTPPSRVEMERIGASRESRHARNQLTRFLPVSPMGGPYWPTGLGANAWTLEVPRAAGAGVARRRRAPHSHLGSGPGSERRLSWAAGALRGRSWAGLGNHRNVYDLMAAVRKERSAFPLLRLEYKHSRELLPDFADRWGRKRLKIGAL